MKKALILGYGNPDREDDGVAWHILQALSTKLGLPAPDSYEAEFAQSEMIDFSFYLQLTPEMGEEIAGYEYVCFVDAHTQSTPESISFIKVESNFQKSPLTHHLTPQSLLSICEAIYGHKPQAMLLSVRGHRFQFTRELSEETKKLVPLAVELIFGWLNTKKILETALEYST